VGADGQTDMTKLIVAFRKSANAPKNEIHLVHTAKSLPETNYTSVRKCKYAPHCRQFGQYRTDKRRTFLYFFVLATLQRLLFSCAKMTALQMDLYQAHLSRVPARSRVSQVLHLSFYVCRPSTLSCNITFCILPTQLVYAFSTFTGINSDYVHISTQHSQTGLRN
jgi:hypothetical protein